MNNNKRKGFTLIEMVVVIAIIAIIGAIAIPQALKSVNKSKATADIANAKAIANAITQGISDGRSLQTTNDWTPVKDNIKADSSSQDWLNNYMPTLPDVKMTSGDSFWFSYSGDTLLIGIGSAANKIYPLYPDVKQYAEDVPGTATSNTSPYWTYK